MSFQVLRTNVICFGVALVMPLIRGTSLWLIS